MTDHIASAPSGRLVEALNDPDRLYDRTQLAYLMAFMFDAGYTLRADEDAPDALSWRAGYDAGYRQRVAEENARRPSPQIFHADVLAGMLRVQGERAAARADRTQRYAGGPVEVWEADRPDYVPPDVPVKVRMFAGSVRWADET